MKKQKYVYARICYTCIHCGKIYQFYVEEGIDDGKVESKHAPLSFICKRCGGCAVDRTGIRRLTKKIPLTHDMNYISNRHTSSTGVPTIRKG